MAPDPIPRSTAIEYFSEHRGLLFSVAYHLLGSVQDAEDAVQESWLAWQARYQDQDLQPVQSPRGYLVRIVTNQALARRRLLERRKESYLGPWLPEPIVQPGPDHDGEQAATRAEVVSLAMLVVLESLSPSERAVFVLREVFGYAHREIAEVLATSEQNVRQLAHRARAHVRARRPRFRADPAAIRSATRRFLDAVLGGDLDALLRVLAPGVTLYSDGGGKSAVGGPRPVRGRDKVSRLAVAMSPDQSVSVCYQPVNGDPAAVLYRGSDPLAVVAIDLAEDGRVENIYVVSNPDKLANLEPGQQESEQQEEK